MKNETHTIYDPPTTVSIRVSREILDSDFDNPAKTIFCLIPTTNAGHEVARVVRRTNKGYKFVCNDNRIEIFNDLENIYVL